MKLFIPTLGTKIILTAPLTFTLYDERRNEKFWAKFHGIPESLKNVSRWDRPSMGTRETTLPKGTILKIDRIFLRAGAKDFDSVTFQVVKTKGIEVPPGRFWVKLPELNEKLEFDIFDDSNPWPNGKFSVMISEGQYWHPKYCKCGNYWNNRFSGKPLCSCPKTNWPLFKHHGLRWLKNPGNRFDHRGILVSHNTDTEGLDKITSDNAYVDMANWNYCRDFHTFEEVIEWAKQKELTPAHITEFKDRYQTYHNKTKTSKSVQVNTIPGP